MDMAHDRLEHCWIDVLGWTKHDKEEHRLITRVLQDNGMFGGDVLMCSAAAVALMVDEGLGIRDGGERDH